MYELYTVKQFEDAWFKKDRSVMNDYEFDIVYSEYFDNSGLYQSEDFEKQALIYNVSQRLDYVRMFIRLQRDFIEMFKIPFVRDFNKLKNKYGYKLVWRNDLEDFKKQLLNIEYREEKTDSFLRGRIKDLKDFRAAKGKKDDSQKTEEEKEQELRESRKGWIRTINSLGKVGYRIEKTVTTVEELSLMIKQQLEDQEEMKKHAR